MLEISFNFIKEKHCIVDNYGFPGIFSHGKTTIMFLSLAVDIKEYKKKKWKSQQIIILANIFAKMTNMAGILLRTLHISTCLFLTIIPSSLH